MRNQPKRNREVNQHQPDSEEIIFDSDTYSPWSMSRLKCIAKPIIRKYAHQTDDRVISAVGSASCGLEGPDRCYRCRANLRSFAPGEISICELPERSYQPVIQSSGLRWYPDRDGVQHWHLQWLWTDPRWTSKSPNIASQSGDFSTKDLPGLLCWLRRRVPWVGRRM